MTAPFSEEAYEAQERAKKLLSQLPTPFDIERELCRRSLYHFAKRAFALLEPGRQFKDNWHIKSICDHLQAISEGKIKKLLINVPPRHMKSLLVSVIWPVWDWIGHPSRQFLTASYRQPLATRDALKSRQLLQSPWFISMFGAEVRLGRDQNEKMRYQNTARGHRIAITSEGGVGEGGDFLIADDPQNTDKMSSPAYVESTTDWWNGTFMQRLNDPATGAVVLTMQRLSEKDLCAEALKEDDWVHLMFPAEFEPARRCVTVLGVQDPRTKEGELLWPARVPKSFLDKQKIRLGAYGTAGQLQQRPAPLGGGVMKRDDFRTIRKRDLPHFFHHVISWDTAATENENNDPTGATVWGLSRDAGREGLFKLGQLEEWLDAPALERRIPEFGRLYPYGTEHLIEAAGPTGLAMTQLVKAKNPSLIITPADPKKLGGGKTERASLAAVYLRQGLVWLVEDDPTNETFLDKMATFPKCDPRDVADSAVQAIVHCCTTYTFETGDAFAYESESTDRLTRDTLDDDW